MGLLFFKVFLIVVKICIFILVVLFFWCVNFLILGKCFLIDFKFVSINFILIILILLIGFIWLVIWVMLLLLNVWMIW